MLKLKDKQHINTQAIFKASKFVWCKMSNTKVDEKCGQSFGKNLVCYFRQYCDSTSIHGFKYFGERRSTFEKIWWTITFITCLMLCVYSISLVYKKWDQTPVIVSFATKSQSISHIPFPAIAVCSESKIKLNEFDFKTALIKKLEQKELTEDEEKYLSVLSYICQFPDHFNYSSLINPNFSRPEEFIDTLYDISPDFYIVNCRFLSFPFHCDKFFKPIVTDDGICYSFNILDRSELFNDIVAHYKDYQAMNFSSGNWSVQNGYKEGTDIDTYPTRALLAGARYGLRFDIKIESRQLDSTCRGSIEGFRILFHAPLRSPRLRQDYIRVSYNRSLTASISPSQMTTSKAVANYSPEKRKCYFPLEKKLKFFNIYSQNNCDVECLTNFTLTRCNCVLFYMPRENETKICTGADFECAINAEYTLQYFRLYKRILLTDEKKSAFLEKQVCHCMPMCSDIEYKISSSQSVWNWSEEVESGLYGYEFQDNITNFHLSRVSAYFTSSNFIGSQRNELYGPTDFLANFGGLLGLFTGFSILSLMEIIYFLSVRIVCNVRMFRNWVGNVKN